MTKEITINAKWYFRGDIDNFINENYDEDEREYWQQYYEEYLNKEFEQTYTAESFYDIEDDLKEDLKNYFETTIDNITLDWTTCDGNEQQMTGQNYQNDNFRLQLIVKYND